MEDPHYLSQSKSLLGILTMPMHAIKALPSSSIIIAVILCISVSVACWVVYATFLYPEYFSRFRHLPTPKERNWLWGNYPPNFVEPVGHTLRRINEEVPHDGMVRVYGFLGEEKLLVTHPKAMTELLSTKGYEFTKTAFIKYTTANQIGIGLPFSEGQTHRQQRKDLIPAFSLRTIRGFYPTFWSKSCEFVNCLQRAADDQGAVDAKPWTTRTTLDIIGLTGMGRDFNSLRDPDSGLVRAYEKLFAPPPRLFFYFSVLSRFIGPKTIASLPLQVNKMFEKNKAVVQKVAYDLIQRRRKDIKDQTEKDETTDILGAILRSEADFSNRSLVDHLMVFLAAGHETTSSTFQWLIVELCRQPEIQERVRREVREQLPRGCFPLEAARLGLETESVTADMFMNLPYLKAVCNETIRCYPVAIDTTRVNEVSDSYLQGEFIPRGTQIHTPSQAVNHDPKLWGADAAEFNPERWLAPGQANAGGAKSAFALMTFLHGPHACIGKDFTRAELWTLTACFFGSFRVELQHPDKEIKLAWGISVSPADAVPISITPYYE